MELEELLELKCLDVDFNGNGVSRADGFIVFTPGVLIDEDIIVKIKKKNKKFAHAELMTILNESSFRVKPRCPHYENCGGCNIMHMKYEEQTKYKRHLLQDVLIRVGKILCEVNACIGADEQWFYRNNVQMPFRRTDKIHAGFFKKGTHDVVDISKCYIAPQIGEQIMNFLKDSFISNNISIYSDEEKTGCIKHVIIRSNKKGDVMIILVTNCNTLQKHNIIISGLFRQFPMIKSIIHNINEIDSSVVLGKKSVTIYGSDYIIEEVAGLELQIGANSFFQVNPEQAEKLYNEVIRLLDLKGDEIIIDAYSGVGSMALLLAKKCKYVYGLEIIKDAYDNANDNKIRNNISNVEFILGDVNEGIRKISTEHKIDAIVLDPPRKGCEKEFIDVILEMGIKKVIYVSCNIRTLSRDLKIFKDNGYKVEEATPIDMFPQTAHVECTVLISKI